MNAQRPSRHGRTSPEHSYSAQKMVEKKTPPKFPAVAFRLESIDSKMINPSSESQHSGTR